MSEKKSGRMIYLDRPALEKLEKFKNEYGACGWSDTVIEMARELETLRKVINTFANYGAVRSIMQC